MKRPHAVRAWKPMSGMELIGSRDEVNVQRLQIWKPDEDEDDNDCTGDGGSLDWMGFGYTISVKRQV